MKPVQKSAVVISAVNINEGGALSVLRDAVYSLLYSCHQKCKLVLLVNKKEFFQDIADCKQVELIQFNYPKKAWLLRIWFEYVHCFFLSRKMKSDVWIAMNDITPNVLAKTKIVYCQNPFPFYKLGKNVFLQKKAFFFHFFYAFFYSINIKKNKYVFVQQQWLREEFVNRFNVKNVVVAHPNVVKPPITSSINEQHNKFVFVYPALPRVSKNFEILFQAVQQLQEQYNNFELLLTFNGSENKYASVLVDRYKHLQAVRFLGVKDRDTIWQLYQESSCLVFPSKMETWGLPITEMKTFNKPILVANCKYALETVGNYNKACLFNADDATELATLMAKAIDGTLQYQQTNFTTPPEPFVQSWKELFDLVLSENN